MKPVAVNTERKPPIVEIDGVAVLTRDGIPLQLPENYQPVFGVGKEPSFEIIEVPDDTPTVML